MRRVQLRGGARWPHARRTRVGGVRGHVWAPQTKVRRPDCLARYVARRSRAPYLRRWALLIALARRVDEVPEVPARATIASTSSASSVPGGHEPRGRLSHAARGSARGCRSAPRWTAADRPSRSLGRGVGRSGNVEPIMLMRSPGAPWLGMPQIPAREGRERAPPVPWAMMPAISLPSASTAETKVTIRRPHLGRQRRRRCPARRRARSRAAPAAARDRETARREIRWKTGAVDSAVHRRAVARAAGRRSAAARRPR